MTIAYCSAADLEVALGGAAVLVQLADPGQTGTADAGIVQDYLESGAAEIRPFVEVKHEPETIANLDSDSLRRLRDANAALSARIAWEKGGMGQAMPQTVTNRAERTEQFCRDLSMGVQRLGRVAGGTQASLGQNVQVVDSDPYGHGTTVASYRSNGFR